MKPARRTSGRERIMLRELPRRADMMMILENKLDALVRLHTPWAPGVIGHPRQYDISSNLSPESLRGPNAGLTEVLITAGCSRWYFAASLEDIGLKIASAYEAISRRRVPPPTFGPLAR